MYIHYIYILYYNIYDAKIKVEKVKGKNKSSLKIFTISQSHMDQQH